MIEKGGEYMVSVKGRIAVALARKFYNLNSEINPDMVSKMRLMERHNSDETSPGYTIEKRVLEDGTRYEFVCKQGKQPGGKLVLYLHGGAYIAGLIGAYRRMADQLCPAADPKNCADLILLDYDCAPEHVYPTQLKQTLSIWDYVTRDLGYKEEDIVVGGDSAGGNLTLALLLKLRDGGRKMPKCAFCLSPWADMTASGQSYTDNYSKDPLFGLKGGKLTEEKRKELINCNIYSFTGGADRRDKYVSPVFASYEGFPKMFFCVGSHEMLLSDTLTIVDKLKSVGNEPVLEIGEGMFHVYPIYYNMFSEAKRSFARLLKFITANMSK